MLTILMVVFNNEENAKMSIESIRNYNDIEELELVVVNNDSTDDFDIWAKEQTDFSYVYVDTGKEKAGNLLNAVIDELDIENDILIIDGNTVIFPNTLLAMKNMLDGYDDIAAVGGVSHIFSGAQLYAGSQNYEEIYKECIEYKSCEPRYVVGLNTTAVMLKGRVIKKLNGFDGQFDEMHATLQDFMLRANDIGRKCAVCSSAFWGVIGTNEAESGADAIRLEKKWGMHYFNFFFNRHLVGAIHEENNEHFDVLEIGCDCGATLLEIKNNYPNANIYGTDINESAVKIASFFMTATVNNIEECDLGYRSKKFKYIILGDVLEHLRNPKEVLEYCNTLLTDDGHIIACIPNLMHISVIDELLQGNFTYRENGLLDKTHIHLFTLNEIKKMFAEVGFDSLDIEFRSLKLAKEEEMAINKLLTIYPETPAYMFRTFQYVVDAYCSAE